MGAQQSIAQHQQNLEQMIGSVNSYTRQINQLIYQRAVCQRAIDELRAQISKAIENELTAFDAETYGRGYRED